MESIILLTELERLPVGHHSVGRWSHQEQMQALRDADPIQGAAEATAATSLAMWGLFDGVNVGDTLSSAYSEQYPGLAAEHSLYEHWLEVTDRGADAADGFLSGLKGKVAEFNTVDLLESMGYADVQIAGSATQPVWDITAVSSNGEEVLWQVKTGVSERAGDVQALMLDNPEVQFAVSTEIYGRIAEHSPDLMGQMLDIGSDFDLVVDISDGLDTLADNMGIDLPDGVGDLLPYAAAIMTGARLIYGALRTERQFKHLDRTERNKVQVIQALTAMSRIGVTVVLSMAGAAAGSVVPLLGNVVGGVAGMVGGAAMGSYLNRYLQPHMLDLALDITGLTHDDLFYYKNKLMIDAAAYAYQANGGSLRSQLAEPWHPRE